MKEVIDDYLLPAIGKVVWHGAHKTRPVVGFQSGSKLKKETAKMIEEDMAVTTEVLNEINNDRHGVEKKWERSKSDPRSAEEHREKEKEVRALDTAEDLLCHIALRNDHMKQPSSKPLKNGNATFVG